MKITGTHCLLALLAATTSMTAMAQAPYPAKPVRLVVPYPPGGGNDTLARLFGQKLTEAFGQHLYAKPGYDALRDFAPVSLLVIAPTLLVVNPALPANSLKELIAPAIVGTISGEAQMLVYPAASALPHVKSGRLRPLAIARASRLPELPQVPTFAEAGMPEYTASAWYSVHAPAKTPSDIVARLNKELVRSVNLPDFKERLKDLGSDGVGNTQDEFGRFVADEHAKYGKLIKTMGIKPE